MHRQSRAPRRRGRSALFSAGVALASVLVAGCTPDQWVDFWFRAYGATDEQVADALAIAHCESRMRPDARNGSNRGLMQINISPRAQGPRLASLGYTAQQMSDPSANAHVAADLWAARGQRFSGSSGWPACARRHGIR
jgi:soluble lytic murein transglycosylase-like protein